MAQYEVREVRFRTRVVHVEARSPANAETKVDRGEGQVVGYCTDPIHHVTVLELKDGKRILKT